ncbi:hypothetical protein GCM10010954_10820 [Halobacillus andaensis]|uniref:SnoaL-like domain-containing protein n=1 Tax=Halobacillus andaensis TaxID=1176239 RepID=A0A917EU55_HALAA|nr:nuclear transport factor 2 family protein [Halobacillus andaensis]MBP2003874.1 ketosteroid isomerase-like protein [Halobacillus andaensis]GGF13916.1 hypothetical protein GCM10010954_10820 [Halobacillus andaensis]
MSKKEQLLREFNEAFIKGDHEFVLDHVTENIAWEMVGTDKIEGKEAFSIALEEMKNDAEVKIVFNHVITHGITAAVDGTIYMKGTEETKIYSFCDIYKFNTFKEGKIKELKSYVVDITES